MPANGKTIIARYDSLKAHRTNFDARWEELAKYVAPSRQGIRSQNAPGQSQTASLYDSTSAFAADILAKFIAGSVTNAAAMWFSLKMRDPELSRDDAVREWLDDTRNRMHRELSQSNFYAEVFETYVDYGGFGTGSLMCRERPQSRTEPVTGWRGIHFTADKIGRYVVSEDEIGRVNTHLREFKLTAAAAVDMWGLDKVPELVRRDYGKPESKDKLFTFVMGVLPRELNDRGFGSRGMPWASVTVEKESKEVVDESGFRGFPFFVPRWQKTPGEFYGRGPGEIALPDTQTLNKAKEMGLEDWALKIRPPVLVTSRSVVGGKLRIKPASSIAVRTQGRPVGDVIAPYQTGSHPEVSQIKEEELRRSIRQAYFVDQILALLEVDKPQMTATEFLKKLELLNRILGPVYGRMVFEFLNPLIDRVFDLMYEGGALSTPPDILLEQGGEIDVEFESPLAKAQRAAEVEAIQMTMADVGPMVQVDPSVLDNYDMDEAARLIGEVRGVPGVVMRSEDEVAEIRRGRAEDMAKQEVMQENAALAEGAQKAAPMVKALQGAGAGPGARQA